MFRFSLSPECERASLKGEWDDARAAGMCYQDATRPRGFNHSRRRSVGAAAGPR